MKAIVTLYILTEILFATSGKAAIGIYEQLGKAMPMDIVVNDEQGNSVKLKDLTNNKPFLFAFVYYKCPGICGPQLIGSGRLLDKINLDVGKDFNLVTLSFDPEEDSTLARAKKTNYLAAMERKIPENSWHFLTGSQESISVLTEAVGFKYEKNSDGTYTHAAALIAISPTGKITRYLNGTDYLPLDAKLALLEASEGRVGPTVAKLLQYCFSYDPEGRKYVFNFLRVAGGTVTLAGVSFLIFLVYYSRRKNKRRG